MAITDDYRPKMYSFAWYQGLKAHLKRQILNYKSQGVFASSIGVDPAYISKIMTDKHDTVSKNKIKQIAVNSGYEEGFKESGFKQPERSVPFENTRQRERIMQPSHPKKDIDLIKTYMEEKDKVDNTVPVEVSSKFKSFLLKELADNLTQLKPEEL